MVPLHNALLHCLACFLSLPGLGGAITTCYNSYYNTYTYCTDDEYCCNSNLECCTSNWDAGTISGVVVGIIFFIVIVAVVVIIVMQMKKKNQRSRVQNTPQDVRSVTVVRQHQPPPPYPGGHGPQMHPPPMGPQMGQQPMGPHMGQQPMGPQMGQQPMGYPPQGQTYPPPPPQPMPMGNQPAYPPPPGYPPKY